MMLKNIGVILQIFLWARKSAKFSKLFLESSDRTAIFRIIAARNRII